MLAEDHMNSKVFPLLKKHHLSDTKNVNFVKINTLSKLEEYLKNYAKDNGVRGAEEAIKNTVSKQFLATIDGNPIEYTFAIETSSNWSSLPYNMSKSGKVKTLVSGDLTIYGDDDAICRSLHRSMRIPILLRRYTSRINQ